MITRERQPPNLEMPFSELDGFITPTERFYVRCHFPIPQIDPQNWRLKLEGRDVSSRQFSLDELRELPQKAITATLECAGNSRVFLVPKVKGVQWELGAVGNAEWSGVPLREVLQRAGLNASDGEIILQGADKGAIAEHPRPAGEIHFARSLPISKAMDDVVLATHMNGQPLTPAHGFPLRAVVPGWYGMASIKWLERIVVSAEKFSGYYQTVDYAYWQRNKAGPVLTALSEMQPKAQIARPQNHEVITAGGTYLVRGAAWSGGAEIAKVELSLDGATSWKEAKLDETAAQNAWRLWSFEWNVREAGSYTLLARATDNAGRVQPLERNPDFGTYMIHHCLPVEVEAR